MTDPKRHHVSLEFYNNDYSKKLRVILTGMNKDGKLTHIEKVVD